MISIRQVSVQRHKSETAEMTLHQKIWDSGIGLSSWFARLHSGIVSNTALVSNVKDVLFAPKCDILELGDDINRVSLITVLTFV